MNNEIDEIIQLEEINNASSYNKSDTDDEIVNINKVALKIGNFFNDWKSVQEIIDSYAKQNRFVVAKSHKNVDLIDKSII
jgi:hypothetical protein